MSQLVIPDTGKKPIATVVLSGDVIHRVHLFKNAATVDHTLTLGGLTEADFSGYASIVLTGGAVQAALDASRRAVILWDFVSWTKSGVTANANIYGYYYTDSGGALIGAELWDASEPMVTDGTVLGFTPMYTERSEFSN